MSFVAQCAMVPILSHRGMPHIDTYLGSGFFIEDNATVMTARHVVEGLDVSGMFICITSPTVFEIGAVRETWLSDTHDVAVLSIEPMVNAYPLRFFVGEEPFANIDVTSYEWSRTAPIVDSGRSKLGLRSTFHKGHVMRWYWSNFPEKVPTLSCDLSYPALRGASGAAVVLESDYSVIGMIHGNVESEVQPIQVMRTQIDGESYEEVHYYLPSAKAIAWRHLHDCLAAARLAMPTAFPSTPNDQTDASE